MDLPGRLEIWRESARSHGRKLVDLPEEMSLEEYGRRLPEILEGGTEHEGSPEMFGLRTREYSEIWREVLEQELEQYDIPEGKNEELARLLGYDLRENMRNAGIDALEPTLTEEGVRVSPDDLGKTDWLYRYVDEFAKRDRITVEPALIEDIKESEAGWKEVEAFTMGGTSVYTEDWMNYKQNRDTGFDSDIEEYAREIGVGQ